MNRNINITLGQHLEQSRETKLSLLREDLITGENSGFTDYKLEDIISELDSEG